MLTGRDIVLIASIDWDPLWQSHQEIATRFAKAGNRVLFIENTGVRTPTVADASRLAKRIKGWSRSLMTEPRQIRSDLWVYSPLVFPPFSRRSVRKINRALLIPAITRAARRLRFVDPIIWTWLPTETALDIAGALSGTRSLLIYFNIADFKGLVQRPSRLKQAEDELLRSADVVFTYDATSQLRTSPARRVEPLPPSVNLEHFFLSPVRPEIPARPVIGYVGGVHRFLDLELIAECARRTPQWDWTLIGPLQIDVTPLKQLRNVHLVGARNHEVLPELVASFDVAVVPYRVVPETKTLAPTKINEYLASGKPTVATNLPWVTEFQERHAVLEVCTDSPDSFVAACERALTSTVDPSAAVRRRQVAEQFSWRERLEAISGIIEEIAEEKESKATLGGQ